MHTPSKSGDIFLSEARDKDATACHGDIADRTTATASATDASQNLIYAPDPDKYRIVPERLIFPCCVMPVQNCAKLRKTARAQQTSGRMLFHQSATACDAGKDATEIVFPRRSHAPYHADCCRNHQPVHHARDVRADLSGTTDTHRRTQRRRRADRHRCARTGTKTVRVHGPASDCREPPGRGRRGRHRGRGALPRRRLHPAIFRLGCDGHHAPPEQQTALRLIPRLRTGVAGRHLAADPVHRGQLTGAYRIRTDRPGQGAAGQTQLRHRRHRHAAASGGGAAQKRRRYRCCPCSL